MNYHHETAAALITRVFLGILFFSQGYDKVFKVKIKGVVETFEYPVISKHFPKSLLTLIAYFTSYVELIGGFLLIIGFLKYYALYFLGFDLILVAVAFGMIKPMWDMQFVFPRLLLLLILLVMPSQWDVISVDYFWSLIKFLKSFSN